MAKKAAPTTAAAAAAAATSGGIGRRGIVFMALLAVQYGFHSLLTSTYIHPKVIPSSIVIAQEVIKFGLALAMLLIEGMSIKKAAAGWTLGSSFLCAAFPSVIYAVQNWLIWFSAQHLDGLTFNLINQSKIIWTALFVFIFVKQRQSPMQLVALGLIFLTAVILSFRDDSGSQSKHQNDFYLGVIPTLVASLCSGVAAGLTQFALQSQKRNSYIYTMELCIFTLLTMVVSIPFSNDGLRFKSEGFFGGWEAGTVIPIINNAAGGIFTGMVVKYAGGVQKGFSIIFALMITAILQWLVQNRPLSGGLALALPLGLLGLWLHTNFPYRRPAPKTDEKREK